LSQDNEGTLITSEEKIESWRKKMEDVVVSAVTFDKNQAKMSMLDVPDHPGIAAKIFGGLAKGGINVDMIIQSAASDKKNDISFTISRNDIKKALVILAKVKKVLKAKDVIYDDKVAKVSIVGVGMRSHAGVAAKMFEVMAKNKINIDMISTSEIKVSCVVREEDVNKSVEHLHAAFGLNR
jgi:aspartate kinase